MRSAVLPSVPRRAGVFAAFAYTPMVSHGVPHRQGDDGSL